MLNKFPNETNLIIKCFACHGMIMDGRQIVLFNEYHKSYGFYKHFAVEEDVRQDARKFSNAYYVIIFACCREIRTLQQHSGGFSKEYVIAKRAEQELLKNLAIEKLAANMTQAVSSLLE